jgi:hypothetical protein
LLLTWMEQMHLAATIDQCWQPHREWEGLRRSLRGWCLAIRR